jgi:flagellar hook-associated protein 1 FlgK
MNVISNNIANANTPGYARQIFQQGTRASLGNGFISGGVIALGVTNFIDPFVERQLTEEFSDLGTYDGRRLALSNMENILYESDGEGIGTALSEFFNSWSELSQDASSGALRVSVREAARTLADRLNNAHAQLQELRGNMSSTISTRVDQVNSLTAQLASLNDTIRNATDDTAKLELKAQRTVVLQELSQEVGINYFEAADETITVQLVGTGLSLVNSNQSATLSVNDDLSSGGNLAIESTIAGGGSSTIDVTSYINNGRLGGNLIERNTTMNNALSDVNQLAFDLADQINTLHQAGYGLDGNNGRNFFAPLAGVDNAAALISLDASIETSTDNIAAAEEDPAVSGVGDARNALAIVDLANQLTMSGGTQTFSQ